MGCAVVETLIYLFILWYPNWHRRWSQKPLFVGSSPTHRTIITCLGGRVAECAPLLRELFLKKEHGGSNPLPNAITAIVKKDEGVSTTMLEKFLLENNIPEKIFSISEIDKLNEDLLWEMSVVKPRRSGLPYKIWLDPMGVTRGNEHTFSPRLKVEVDGNFIPVEISDNPKIPDSVLKHGAKEPRNFSKVYNYIKKYKDIFLAHFYGELDENEVLNFVGKESEADSLI